MFVKKLRQKKKDALENKNDATGFNTYLQRENILKNPNKFDLNYKPNNAFI